MIRTKFYSAILICTGLFLWGCSSTNENFCDESTACDSETRSFCNIGDNTCITPPSANACNSVQPCPAGELAFCSDEGGGECVACLENSQCDGDMLCSPTTNSCVSFSCSPGTEGDALCAEVAVDLPYCASGNLCALCAQSSHCTSDASVCDDESFTCRGCEADNECDSGVCREDSGECVSESDIVHVATTGSLQVTCGSAEMPCQTIEAGLAVADSQRNTLLIQTGTYGESIVINLGTRFLQGVGEVNVVSEVTAPEAALSVSGDSTVAVEGITFAPVDGNSQTVVTCTGEIASLTMENVVVKDAEQLGILSTCNLIIRDSTISDNKGGIEATSSTLLVERSQVLRNHIGFRVAILADSSDVVVRGSTVSGNFRGFECRNSSCELSASIVSENTFSGVLVVNSDFVIQNNVITRNINGLSIRNSMAKSQLIGFNTISDNDPLTANDGGSFDCSVVTPLVSKGNIIHHSTSNVSPRLTNCTLEFSNTDGVVQGNGNISVPPLFVNPVAGESGDYHLRATSMCIDAIPPSASDITVDLDGDPRPGNGRLDMGADEAN